MAIEIDVRSRSAAAQKDLDNLEKKIQGVGKSTQKLSQNDFKALSQSVESINTSIKGLGERFSKLAVGVGSLVAATAGLSSLARATDSFTRMSNKLKVTTDNINEYNRALIDTRKIAIETGQNLEDITTLYSKLNFATRSFGASQKDVARVTSTVSKALAASGAQIQERQAVILQLGQAMSSAFVQGDELRTLREAAPFLIKTVADNLGVTVGEIKKLGEQGALSSELFFNALLAGSEETQNTFSKMSATYEKAFTTFGIGIELFAKQFMSAFGAGSFAETLNIFAKNFARAALNFDSTILRMRASLWIFVADLSKGFPKVVNGFRETIKKISSSVMSIKMPKIDLGAWIPRLDPIKNKIMSFVETIEHGFWWLYDKVVGNSWWPDLIIEIGQWAGELLKKPLEYVMSFANKVNDIFKNMLGPKLQISTVGMASAITTATIIGLVTAFATGSVFKTLAFSIGTAAVMGLSKEANGIASVIGAVFASAITIAVGNPLIKIIAASIATVFTAAAIDSKADITKTFGNAVLDGLRWAFDKIVGFLYGDSLFGDRPFAETLALLAKIALLFSAGRAAFFDAAKSLAGAGNSVGKNLSDASEKFFRNKDLGALTKKLENQQNLMKQNLESAKKAVNLERSRLASLKYASGQTLGSVGLKQFDVAARSGNPAAMSAFLSQLSGEAKQAVQNLSNHNRNLSRTIEENKRLEATRIKSLKEAISNQKGAVDRLSNSLREASLRSQNAAGNLVGGAAGVFGGFAGYNVGKKIADGMTDSAPWVKLAVPFAGAFIGQMLASGVGQIVGRFVYLLTIGIGGALAKAFWTYITLPLVTTFYRSAILPLSSMLVRGIAAALASSLAPIFLIPAAAIGLTVVLAEFGPTIWEYMKLGAEYVYEKMKEATDFINEKANIWKTPEEPQKTTKLGTRETSVETRGWLGTLWDTVVDSFMMRGGLIPTPSPEDLSKSIKAGAELALTAVSGTAQAANAPTWTEQQAFIADLIRAEADKQGVGQYKELLVSLAARESSLNPLAKNPQSTASGVFQFVKGTAEQMGIKNVFDAQENVAAGVKHFVDNLKKFGGDANLALAAHHVGPGKAKQALMPGSSVGDVDVTTRQWLSDIILDVSKRTGTTPVVGESLVDKTKSKIEALTPDFVKDLQKAYEQGGLKGTYEKLKEQLTELFKFEAPEIVAPEGLKEVKTEFLSMLEAAKTSEDTLDLINKKLASLGAPGLASLDALEGDFENFFANIVKIEEIISQLADPNIAYFARRNLEKVRKELEDNIKKTANALREVNEVSKDTSWKPSTANIEDGANAAKQFTNSVSQGFSSALKGEHSFKDLGNSLLDTFTSNIVDAFSKNFIEVFMKTSGIEGMISDLFANVFMIGDKAGGALGALSPLKDKESQVINANTAIINTAGMVNPSSFGDLLPSVTSEGFKLFDSVKDMFGPSKEGILSSGPVKAVGSMIGGQAGKGDITEGLFDLTLSKIGEVDLAGSGAFESVAEVATGSFEGLGSTITGIFKGLGSSIGDIFSSLFGGGGGGFDIGGLIMKGIGLLGFAEGGKVSGAGTGTSDSILARLSHGEFVINAAQARKYMPLLEAINENRIPKFASGGAVGNLPDITPLSIASKESQQQVFNINITGDISRQTKREIYTMLPEIANGVNSYNREVGYRG